MVLPYDYNYPTQTICFFALINIFSPIDLISLSSPSPFFQTFSQVSEEEKAKAKMISSQKVIFQGTTLDHAQMNISLCVSRISFNLKKFSALRAFYNYFTVLDLVYLFWKQTICAF